jgi:transposase
MYADTLDIFWGLGRRKSLTIRWTCTKLYLQVIRSMISPPDRQQKRQTLRRHGTLNPQPESVTHPLFQNSDFFDPDDLLQVKYEMLRQVHVDQESISEAARAFGFSRPSFYQAQSAFQQDGVFGLLPHKRGPRGGHKLTSEVMDFVIQQRSEDPALTPEQLAQAIQKRFRVRVHPRSIQRRLLAEKKRR